MLYVTLLSVLLPLAAAFTPTCNPRALRRVLPGNLRPQPITVLTLNDSSPFVMAAPNGVPHGFDIDLMNIISYIYDVEFMYEYKDFVDIIPAVQEDENTISISTHTITAARSQLVDFAQFFRTGTGFVVRSDYTEEVKGLKDLCGKKVVVITGSIQEADVDRQTTECGSNSIIKTTVLGTTDLFDAIIGSTADVGLYDEAIIVTAVVESNGALKAVGEVYDVAPYGILCNKKNRGLCCSLVTAINHLVQDGAYKRLLEAYSFSFENNGICPSRINLKGPMCSRRCRPPPFFCEAMLS